jgi:hypothetical protein
MIRDLSLALKAILDDPALHCSFPELADAQIVFDRPTESFHQAQTTIDLFLYDIRENMELRSNEPKYERLDGQTRIHRPPMRVACSYLVTAWPVCGADLELQEHRLLSQALQVLSRYPKIPDKFLLGGKLEKQEPPLPMMTAQTDGLREPAEFWAAIGGKMRPSITVTVTIAMELSAPEDAAQVITHEVRLGERTAPNEMKLKPATEIDLFSIAGKITDANGKPVVNAEVSLVKTGLVVTTNSDGTYALGSVVAGEYTLHVQSGQTTKDVTVKIPAEAGKNYNVQL